MRCLCFECLGDEPDIRAVTIVEVGPHDINVNELVRVRPVPLGGRVLDRVVADGDDQIGRLREPVRWLVGQLPDAATGRAR